MNNIAALLHELTVEEKAALLEGYQSWMTNPVPRLDIPPVYMTDGPVGVRKKRESEANGAVGLGSAYPATAFPTSVAIANSWNTDNAEKMGYAIGAECVSYDVDILLAPALNLKRDPRCGRNFEYYAEDPILAGKMAAAFTRGVQSTGTAACPKHFALNNCENYRYMGDSIIDERAARELYLKAFEICVKEGYPRTMMCAYNKVNGEHCSQNNWLIEHVLRGEWGYQGLMMTDWGATKDRVAGVKAGMDLDMPGNVWDNRRSIVEAVKDGSLSPDTLDRAVEHVLHLVEQSQTGKEAVPAQEELFAQNHSLAVDLACDSAVLLKNENLLPLCGREKVVVIGELFEKPRYQGAGSSGVNPVRLSSAKNAFDSAGVSYTYLPGYHEESDQIDTTWEENALAAAAQADIVLYFCGLTELFESEGVDRKDLALPACQLHLIERLTGGKTPVAAVLFGGSPFELPFADHVGAILHMFLPGQGGGEACRKLLYGEVSPSGKLSETWVRRTEDILFGEDFGKNKIVPYRENIFVGYRYFDLQPECIRFPFGHGLSYTSFSYSDLEVRCAGDLVTAELTITNTGDRDGAEVIQLYVGKNPETQVFKAEKELKAFSKIYLTKGESRRVSLSFLRSDMAYYHPVRHEWILENGEYPLFIAASSRDIRLCGSITVSDQASVPAPYSEAVVNAYSRITTRRIPDAIVEETIGAPLPSEPSAYPFTMETPVCEFKASRFGSVFFNALMGVLNGQLRKLQKLPDTPEKAQQIRSHLFTMTYIPGSSPRGMVQSGGGLVQMHIGRAMVEFANGHPIRALAAVLHKDKKIPLPIEKTR